MKVVIIGSGNVATVLGRKILKSEHEIIQVAGRNREEVAALASALNAGYTTDFTEMSLLADIYIICVSDLAISSVASRLQLDDKVVVHTAAAVSKEVLAHASTHYGVLYPLQTLKKEVTSLPVIPIVIDANNETTKQRLMLFAEGWAEQVSVASDEVRLKLHVAAVFVNNFTNHLFAIADQFCRSNSIDFDLLQPLMGETISRIEKHRPLEVQTGPAMRKDFDTILKHRKVLEEYAQTLDLYNSLTKSIGQFYDANNE